MTTSSAYADLAASARLLEGEGRTDDAVAAWRAALDTYPADDEALGALHYLLTRHGRPREAAEICARAIEAGSTSTVPWRLMAVTTFNDLGDADGAAWILETAVARGADDDQTRLLAAELAYRRRDATAMCRHGLEALKTASDDIALQVRQQIFGDHEAALEIGLRLLERRPFDANLLVQCGHSERQLGRLEAAKDLYLRAAALAPYRGDVIFPLAEVRILLGELEAGFGGFEALVEDPSFTQNPIVAPHLPRYWRGEPLDGKSILVKHNVGLGDFLMYARYAKTLKAMGAHVILCCQPSLARLFQGVEGADEIIAGEPGARLGEVDHWVFEIHLPLRLGAKEGRILAPSGGYVARPTLPLGSALTLPPRGTGRLQVGLCWSASPSLYSRDARLPAAADLRPLSEVEGIAWHLFQTWRGQPDIEAASGLKLHDRSHEWADFYDSGLFAGALDLTISIDSAPAHLAGALGLPVWAMIPEPPEWRWGRAGERSPWYPDTRLFRQPKRGDWLSVATAVAGALQRERETLFRRP